MTTRLKQLGTPMVNLVYSGASSESPMSLTVHGLDCDGSKNCQRPPDAMLFGDTAVPGAVKAGHLGGLDCIREGITELASDCKEIVPDSDDEEMGRQEAVIEARVISISRLQIDNVVGRESIKLENQGPTVNGLDAEDEEHGIVADSEEESDEGHMKKVGNSANGRPVVALEFPANDGLDVDLLKHPIMTGKGRVLNEHDGFISNSDIFRKKSSESLNGSQQPGESSQADALKFIDHFLKCEDFDLSSEGKSKTNVKQTSPPKSCSKGVKVLAQKIISRSTAVGFSSYNWIDREPNKQSAIVNRSDMIFYSRQRKRCAINKPVITTVKSNDGNLCSLPSNQHENQEDANLSNETDGEVQTGKTFITGSEDVEIFAKAPKSITGNIDKDSYEETRSRQQDSGTDEGGNDDDVFNTQMAAAVIETLSFEPPKKINTHIHSESSLTINTNYPEDFREKEAKLGSPSLQSGSCSGLRRNDDRFKHKKRTNGEAGSDTSAFHENDVKKWRRVDPQFSFRKENKPCNEKNVPEKLFWKTVVEKKGNEAASECIKEVYEEPHAISLDSKACRSLSKSGLDAKFSTAFSPMRWMSKAQQSSEQKTKDGAKGSVYTYKRRRSALVRKEHRSPNENFDLAAVKSNIKSRKVPKNVSNVTPFSCVDLNTLIFPKGQRTSRGASNLRHLDINGDARSETDTEKEVKYPLAKRYKPANHCAEPAWLKFSRKRRTSAARNRQGKGMDSCKAKAVKRFSSDCNKSRSCAGDGGKNDDSSTFYDSNSLTSVSSNGNIVPPVSSLNSYHCKKSYPQKMPKSSLIRELIQLEFSDVPLDSSCKNLRRRKHLANVRVLLSQHLDNDTIMQQKKVLARLGISIATSASYATHFVTNSFSRTKNMLEAIALGIPIVTELWLESCAQAGCLVDEKSYILQDAKKEKEIGFRLSASLAKAARYPLLKDRKVFITPNIKPDKGMLIGLVKMAQGEVVEIRKNYQLPEDVIALSCEEDYTLCKPFLDKGIPVYHAELLLNGIVIQKLELQRHQLVALR